MAAPEPTAAKFFDIEPSGVPATARVHGAHVADAAVPSPVHGLHNRLEATAMDPQHDDPRYPRAVRIMLPVILPIGLWALIIVGSRALLN